MFEGPSTIATNEDRGGPDDVDTDSVEGVFLEILDQFVGVPPKELTAQLDELESSRRALDAQTTAAIHVAEMSGSFSVDGHRTMSSYLKARFNWSGKQAARWLKMSHFVALYPCVGDAWAVGRIGFDQVQLLHSFRSNSRVRHAFNVLLPMMLLDAEQLLFKDFEINIADIIATIDEDGAHLDRDAAVEHRNAHVLVNGAELDVSVIGGDPVTAAEIVAIFDTACQQEFHADVATRAVEFGDDAANHPLPRTAGQRRHDAFIRIVRAGGAAIADDADAGKDSIAKVVVNVVIDDASFHQILADAGLAPAGLSRAALGELVTDPSGLANRKCESSDGTPIHAHDALRALLHGYVRRVVVDANSVVTDMGRMSRLFTGYARQAARLLARTCDHPGCDLPTEFCEVDHNTEWAAGGRTDQNNARPRCPAHNRFKSRNGWHSKQATNGHHYSVRDDGTIVLPVGARPPMFAEPPRPDPPRCYEPLHLDPRFSDPRFNDPRFYGYGPEDPAEVERLTTIIRQRVATIRAA